MWLETRVGQFAGWRETQRWGGAGGNAANLRGDGRQQNRMSPGAAGGAVGGKEQDLKPSRDEKWRWSRS